jgi:hypothetical protein
MNAAPPIRTSLPTINCPLCDQDFPTHGVPCTEDRLLLPIHVRPQISHRRIPWTGRRPCPECETPPSRPHHMPCEREYCPACSDVQRLTSCLDHFLWTALPSPRDRSSSTTSTSPHWPSPTLEPSASSAASGGGTDHESQGGPPDGIPSSAVGDEASRS